MIIEQTVDIPASHRLTLDVPREVPAGRARITFTPAGDGEAEARRLIEELKRRELPRPHTVEQAVKQAEQEAARPERAPLSSCFGIMKDSPLAQSGAAYQRSIRDEWD
jgi:hypothetical protein